METVRGNLYDHPQYYDLVFGSDWQAEFVFLRACFDKFVSRKVKTLFEPACGTGRLIYRLAKAGYKVSGLDLNEHAVRFCNERLERHGFPASAFVGDMADFTLDKPVDAAFNTINSFRHLPTQALAKAHFKCMAEAVKPGGLYVLGLHLTPLEGTPIEEESWSARRGNLAVNTLMWTIERNVPKRIERCGMNIDVYMPTKNFRIADEISFRIYTASQMAKLLAETPEWEIAETFDFSYRIDEPITIGPETEDVVYILRRR